MIKGISYGPQNQCKRQEYLTQEFTKMGLFHALPEANFIFVEVGGF